MSSASAATSRGWSRRSCWTGWRRGSGRGGSDRVDISARLNQIDELIQEAKSMPLSSSVLVNRDEVLQLVEAARNELPEEIKQARWVVRDREELLAKARKDGEAMVERARVE